MNNFKHALAAGVTAMLILGAAGSAMAQDIIHNQENAESPFASSVIVPPGYTIYYISGSGPAVTNASAPKDSIESLGDTATQTRTTLEGLKARMDKLGISFGDVVQARVYLAADPMNGGKMNAAAMNEVWMKFFGTPAQPNKPARATIEAANLVKPGALVEIEFMAAKKIKAARHAKAK
jgi:enamine deaminase RidA (YjgF/YER057c/UK114 family)